MAGTTVVAPKAQKSEWGEQIDRFPSTNEGRRNLLIPDKLDNFVDILVNADRRLKDNEQQITAMLKRYNIRENGLTYGQLFDTFEAINLKFTDAYSNDVLLPALKRAFPKGNHEANLAAVTGPLATSDPYKEYLIAPDKGLPESHYKIQEQPAVAIPKNLKNIIALQKDSNGFISGIDIVGHAMPVNSPYVLTNITNKRMLDGQKITISFRDRVEGEKEMHVDFYLEAKKDKKNPNLITVSTWRIGDRAQPLSETWTKKYDVDALKK